MKGNIRFLLFNYLGLFDRHFDINDQVLHKDEELATIRICSES